MAQHVALYSSFTAQHHVALGVVTDFINGLVAPEPGVRLRHKPQQVGFAG
jgi:hypothetical protein